MKKLNLLLVLFIFFSINTFAQDNSFSKLNCGLWINDNGDIAVKEIGVADPDSGKEFMDYYITYTYNGLDSINDYVTALKDIVDTATFKLGICYSTDKNCVYLHMLMSTPYLVINHLADKETFKVFEENPLFACDKNTCFVMSREIKGADAATFSPVKCDGYLLSRDKNNFYNWNDIMDNEAIDYFEKEFSIKLRD